MAPGEFVKGNDVTLALMGEDSDEQRLTAIFDALADGGTVRANLVIAADGRNSQLRQIAGIEAKTWAYPCLLYTSPSPRDS